MTDEDFEKIIEKLEAANKRLRLEAAHANDTADAAIERTKELEAALAEQIEWVKRLADDLIAAEAKLAENEVRLRKAVEALKMMCEEFRGYDLPYGSKAYSQATSALAVIKSGIATTPYGLEGESRE